jgi:PadR family transcriptional regulator PadR
MPKGDHLGEFEQHVLAALLRLRSNAYGVTIRREIVERTGRDVAVGAIYATLDRLEAKGYVSSRVGEATRERGGRAKRYFDIEAPGLMALEESWRMSDRMRDGLVPAEALGR